MLDQYRSRYVRISLFKPRYTWLGQISSGYARLTQVSLCCDWIGNVRFVDVVIG